MSENQERSGPSGAGIIGGVAAGGGAGYYMANRATNAQVKQALAKDALAPAKMVEKVGGALEKEAGLAAHNTTLQGVKEGKPLLQSLTISGEKGAYKATGVLKSGAEHTLPGIKNLPKGMEAGKALTDQKAIGAIFEGGAAKSKLVLESEQSLVKGVRKAGNIGVMDGFHGAKGFKGKGMIIGSAVAAAVAGGYVVHRLVGGRHSNKVEAERAVQQDYGMNR